MIEDYLKHREKVLTEHKDRLKEDLLEIRSSLRENKRNLDEYMSSSPKPFEPFSPRRDVKYDEELAKINEEIRNLNEQFTNLSSQIDVIEKELKIVNACIDEYNNVIAKVQ